MVCFGNFGEFSNVISPTHMPNQDNQDCQCFAIVDILSISFAHIIDSLTVNLVLYFSSSLAQSWSMRSRIFIPIVSIASEYKLWTHQVYPHTPITVQCGLYHRVPQRCAMSGPPLQLTVLQSHGLNRWTMAVRWVMFITITSIPLKIMIYL